MLSCMSHSLQLLFKNCHLQQPDHVQLPRNNPIVDTRTTGLLTHAGW
jgi:hypothetical protein